MNNVRTKLTLISINGRTIMVDLPADDDGKVRVNLDAAMEAMGLPAGGCIWLDGSSPWGRGSKLNGLFSPWRS